MEANTEQTTLELDTDTKVEDRAKRQAEKVVAAATATASKRTTRLVKRPADKPTASATAGKRVARGQQLRTAGKRPAVNVKVNGSPVAKRTAGKAAVAVDPKVQADAIAKAEKLQNERISKARDLNHKVDENQWELAKLTFQATEEDGPAKMAKTDWAQAIGVDDTRISRWINVHKEYGLSGVRLTVGTGAGKRELSFNDHMEATKVDDKGLKAALKAMQSRGISLAVAIRQLKDAQKNGTTVTPAKGGDKFETELATLVNQATSDDETKGAAFEQVCTRAMQAIVAVREAIEGTDPEAIDEHLKQFVRSVLIEATELENVFSKAVMGD